MGKKDWEKLASGVEANDLAAMGVSPHRGRGWKIFSGLLVVGTATFVLAYYLPLYRAHALLQGEYKQATTESANFRKQLVDTVATLSQTNAECDQLKAQTRNKDKQTEQLASRAERLERSLQGALKKFQGKGRLTMDRQRDKLRITLIGPAAVAATGGDLTDFGKKALCAVGGALKSNEAKVRISGMGATDPKLPSGWATAAVRAGNAAKHLSTSCGVDASHVDIAVSASTLPADGGALLLELTPTE